MSTRSNIVFCNDEGVEFARLYKHWDGYTSNVLPLLERFFDAVLEDASADTRFGDPVYLSARFVVFHADETRGGSLNFTGIGVVPGGESWGGPTYEYRVLCANPSARPRVEWRPRFHDSEDTWCTGPEDGDEETVSAAEDETEVVGRLNAALADPCALPGDVRQLLIDIRDGAAPKLAGAM